MEPKETESQTFGQSKASIIFYKYGNEIHDKFFFKRITLHLLKAYKVVYRPLTTHIHSAGVTSLKEKNKGAVFI
jgi:hypothetical protein